MNWGERSRQFAEASEVPTAADFAFARDHLSGPEFALFCDQHPRDIVHSAKTARWLLTRGHADHDLLVAAFLHDTGKGHQRRRDRVLWVIAQAAHLDERLPGHGSRFEWRRALARSREHAGASADRMAAAGSTARAVDLARTHHLPAAGDVMLALLQEADAAS